MRTYILLGSCALLGGCITDGERAQHVAFADEAGSTHISVLSITPWDEAKADLQPTFALSEADALAKVLPTTGQTEERILNIAAAALKVATPTVTTKDVTTTKSATGQDTTTTSESSRTKASGDATATADATLAAAGAAGLPGAPATWTGAIDNAPMLQYLAATALKQEVVLINRYIKDAAVPKGARTFVVRLQFTAMSSRRNLPYDLFTNISFLPGDRDVQALHAGQCQDAQGSISVLPLLVTDDLESMLTSRTSDSVRQFGLSLLAMLSGVGLSASAQKTSENLTRSLGKEFNSLFTIARLSQDTIRVRLGANSSPRPVDFAMMTRTHPISLLVSVPSCEGSAEFVSTAIARNEFHDAKSGKVLPVRPITPAIVKRTTTVLGQRYAFAPSDANVELLGKLAIFAGQSRIGDFTNAAGALWGGSAPYPGQVNGLYTDLLASKAANQFSYVPVTFDVAPRVPIMPLLDQTVLVPVGKDDSVVRLSQGIKLASADLLATLVVGPVRVAATKVQPMAGGSGVEITFSKLASYGLTPGATGSLEWTATDLPLAQAAALCGRRAMTTEEVERTTLHTRSALGSADAQTAIYSGVRLIAAEEQTAGKPAYTLDISADSVIAAQDSTGEVLIVVTKPGTAKGEVQLTVKGGDVTSVSATAGAPAKTDAGQIKLIGAGAVALRLRNLRPGGRLVIGVTDAGKAIGSPITLEIVAASGGKANGGT